MKKLFGIVLVLFLCIGMVGCSSKSDNSSGSNNSELKTNSEIKKALETAGYATECGENLEGSVDVFAKNQETGQVFILYGSYEDMGLAYQSNKTVLFVDDKEIALGSGDADKLEKEFEKTIKELKISKKEMLSYLKNEKKVYEDKIKNDLSAHKYYKAGTYEVGKDITEGEYLIIASDKISDASYELASTSYDSSDTETFSIDQSFKNSYVFVKNGQFLKVKNAYIYSVDDRPTLNLQNNGVFKVGVDLEAGIYNISPRDDSSYYEIMLLNDEKKFEIATNDFGFTDDIQIKVNDGEYLDLVSVVITKVQ